MKLTERILIHAPPARVWEQLVDPVTWPAWNSRVTAVDRRPTGPLEPSETFGLTFALGRKTTDYSVRVRVLNPNRQLALKQREEGRMRSRVLRVSFDLEPEANGGTQVIQVTDFTEAGMPWWGRMVFRLMRVVGRPVGESPLEALKKRVEGAASAGPTPKSPEIPPAAASSDGPPEKSGEFKQRF